MENPTTVIKKFNAKKKYYMFGFDTQPFFKF